MTYWQTVLTIGSIFAPFVFWLWNKQADDMDELKRRRDEDKRRL